MSDGMAYPKLQLTMSDGTTYPNYNSQCQMAQFIQITTQIVIWHNLSKLQLTMSDGTTYPNYSPQCHDQMAKVIQIRMSE